MNLIDATREVRVGFFKRYEPEHILDVAFMVNFKTSKIEHFILNFENIDRDTLYREKKIIINEVIERIENKSFFNKVHSDINKIDCTLLFHSDPCNSVDNCFMFFLDQNICLYETYTFSGELLFIGTRAISKNLPYNDNKEFIEQLYLKFDNNNLSIKKVVQSNKKNRFKSNNILFKDLIKQENITKLYHFTARENIPSILKNKGLWSWRSCEKHGIEILKAGGDDLSRNLDAHHGLEDYVRLSYNPDHPMMHSAKKNGTILNPVILEINPIVMLLENTQFSDMNATDNNHSVGPDIEDLKKVDFSIAKNTTEKYYDLSDNEKKYYQAEILVYSHIPLNYILNINEFI